MVNKAFCRKLIFIALLLRANQTLPYDTQLSLGWQNYSATQLTGDAAIDDQNEAGNSYIAGITLYNRYGKNEKHHIGTGIEFSEALDSTITGFRAIDYRYHLNQNISFGLFFGAASLDSGLPQNGYFAGISGHWQISNGPLGLGVEYRRADGLARDRLLEDDPDGEKPDIFVDIDSVALKLNWTFR